MEIEQKRLSKCICDALTGKTVKYPLEMESYGAGYHQNRDRVKIPSDDRKKARWSFMFVFITIVNLELTWYACAGCRCRRWTAQRTGPAGSAPRRDSPGSDSTPYSCTTHQTPPYADHQSMQYSVPRMLLVSDIIYCSETTTLIPREIKEERERETEMYMYETRQETTCERCTEIREIKRSMCVCALKKGYSEYEFRFRMQSASLHNWYKLVPVYSMI